MLIARVDPRQFHAPGVELGRRQHLAASSARIEQVDGEAFVGELRWAHP